MSMFLMPQEVNHRGDTRTRLGGRSFSTFITRRQAMMDAPLSPASGKHGVGCPRGGRGRHQDESDKTRRDLAARAPHPGDLSWTLDVNMRFAGRP